ncbi:protein spire-like isoform X3 [Anopheles albimanus]|uniref:protein spire-like isoform X3 n=1 Tax=Anopheles albimanus TaxID=7167 RepID=UPI0016405101|nr:protein spire-like isoform X3 [Anopheles albimanus]
MASETETPVAASPPVPADGVGQGLCAMATKSRFGGGKLAEDGSGGDSSDCESGVGGVIVVGAGKHRLQQVRIAATGRRTTEHTGDSDDQCSEGGPASVKYAKYNPGGVAKGPVASGNGAAGALAVSRKAAVVNCSVSLEEILQTFNAPISEDQAWALIYQAARMFHARLHEAGCSLRDLRVPVHPQQLHIQKDGSCFVTAKTDKELCVPSTQKKILLKLGIVVYQALDYNLPPGEDCHISHDLEGLIDFMTSEDNNDDEGIEHDSEEIEEDLATLDSDDGVDAGDCGTTLDDGSGSNLAACGSSLLVAVNGCGGKRKHLETKELDHVLEYCSTRVSPTKPEDHYRAVCRALVTETLELRTFLQRVCQGEAEVLRLKAQAETTGKELEKIHFNDWSDDQRIWQALQARFWMQVVDELRRGVRLKKISFSRTPIEYELTPYEILMEDIRSRKYNLRKVMVNGDIPPRVKKDAHAVILEFIRSRPPLRKASERKLAPAPLRWVSTPREQLLDSIRKGRVLKPVHPKLKSRRCSLFTISTISTSSSQLLSVPYIGFFLPTTTQLDSVKKSCDEEVDSSGAPSLDGVSSSGSTCSGVSSSTGYSHHSTSKTMTLGRSSFSHTGSMPRNTRRLIPVDFSLFNDAEFIDETANESVDPCGASGQKHTQQQQQQQHQNGGHRISSGVLLGGKRSNTDDRNGADSTNRMMINNENNRNNINTVLRRTTYDLATQCESRRASMRRHTIIGCNQIYKHDPLASHSMPPSRPVSRQSDRDQPAANGKLERDITPAPTVAKGACSLSKEKPSAMVTPHVVNGTRPTPIGGVGGPGLDCGGAAATTSNLSSLDTWTKNSLDENQWKDTFNLNDRLSLTLEEIVHIRSVMTKAELEGLPLDVHIKEDVEKRKVCFLCLRTRFTLFARGILCKLCQRTVCNKCNTKMRIPTEHFRNVPVVLLSPSLMNSPCTSNTPSPSHHAHAGGTGSGPTSMVDESFPRSLMERLLRPELDRKTRNTVGSAPSSPKNQRSASSTPGTSLHGHGETLSLSLAASGAHHQQQQQQHLHHHQHHHGAKESTATATSAVVGAQKCSLMSRSMEGPNSLPPQSPARPHSNCSTLDRKNRFAKAFTLTTAGGQGGGLDPQKERLTGELMAVCNDCRSLVLEIIRSSRQTRTTARNQVLRHLTLDISPVYK